MWASTANSTSSCVEHLAAEPPQPHPRRVAHRRAGVVGDPELDGVADLERRQHRRERALDRVVAGLAEAVVVEQRPAEHGPAVVELPDERARAVGRAAAEVLDAELERLGLGDHREVDELVEVVGDARHRLEEHVDLVLRGVLGVVVHRRAVVLELVGGDPAPQRLAVGRGEHAELADEAARVLRVVPEGDRLGRRGVVHRVAEAPARLAVPDLPVVRVALLARVVVVAAERRARPVGRVRIERRDRARQDLVVEQRAGDALAAALGELHVVDPLVLVVAAPQRERGVAAEPRDLRPRLQLDLLGQRRLRVGRAREHEVLPHEQPDAVAEVVEEVVLVDPAAPDAQHVHVRVARGGDQLLVAVGLHRAHERVRGDPVRAAREDPDAVEHEAEEARARLLGVGPLVELERAHADPALARVDLVAVGEQRDAEVVQRRLAEVVRPPQRRVGEREVGGRRGRRAGSRSRAPARRRRATAAPSPAASSPSPANRSASTSTSTSASRPMRERREVHARQRRLALAAQLDRAPEPDRRQPRAPVPAEAVLRLAHPHALGRRARPLVGIARARVLQRRVEADREQVLRTREHAPGHVERGLAEHVRVAPDLLAVEEDGRERVDAVQDEPQPLVRPRAPPGPRRRCGTTTPAPPSTCTSSSLRS